MLTFARIFVGNNLAKHQFVDNTISEPSAPFGLPSDKPGYPTVIIKNNSNKVATEATKYFAWPTIISRQREQVGLNISMITKKEDRNPPRMAADKFLAEGFCEHP